MHRSLAHFKTCDFSVLRPERAAPCQPRATPWDVITETCLSPARAALAFMGRLVPPILGSGSSRLHLSQGDALG